MDEQTPNISIEEIADGLKSTLEDIGKSLGPEDDWIPVLVCYGEQGAIIGMPDLAEHKEAASEVVIPQLIAQSSPDFVALVTMGWAKDYDQSSLEGRAEIARDEAKFAPGDIEHRPGKYEVITGHIVCKDGREAQILGYVHRHETLHPTIQWRTDLCQGLPKDKSAGRFPDALRKAMWKT